MAALVVAWMPLWFYIAVHWASLFRWDRFWSLLILSAAPWCLLAMLTGAEPEQLSFLLSMMHQQANVDLGVTSSPSSSCTVNGCNC